MATLEVPVDNGDDGDDGDTDGDPRINEEYLREHAGGPDAGEVTLVGVVHDHPASVYRAKTMVERLAPETLALELPPLALPLFEQYAGDGRTLPASGGEMSAAIRAEGAGRTVGIDGPTVGFARRLLVALHRERASVPTVVSSLRALASVSKHALVCRLAAVTSRWLPSRVEVDPPKSYDVSEGDSPSTQAEDERRQVRRAQFVMQAFGASRAGTLRDATREEHMADRLSSLRESGDVVAVVGIDHLDPLVELLDERCSDG